MQQTSKAFDAWEAELLAVAQEHATTECGDPECGECICGELVAEDADLATWHADHLKAMLAEVPHRP